MAPTARCRTGVPAAVRSASLPHPRSAHAMRLTASRERAVLDKGPDREPSSPTPLDTGANACGAGASGPRARADAGADSAPVKPDRLAADSPPMSTERTALPSADPEKNRVEVPWLVLAIRMAMESRHPVPLRSVSEDTARLASYALWIMRREERRRRG